MNCDFLTFIAPNAFTGLTSLHTLFAVHSVSHSFIIIIIIIIIIYY